MGSHSQRAETLMVHNSLYGLAIQDKSQIIPKLFDWIDMGSTIFDKTEMIIMKIHLIILVLVVLYWSMTRLNNFQNIIKIYFYRLTYNPMDTTRIRSDQSYVNNCHPIRALELEDLFINKLLYLIVKIEINSRS